MTVVGRTNNTPNLGAFEQETTSGSTPVRQEQEFEVIMGTDTHTQFEQHPCGFYLFILFFHESNNGLTI